MTRGISAVVGLCAGLAIVLPGAPGARAEVLKASGEGFHVRHVLVIDARKDTVWRALVDPASWWDGAHSRSGDAANLSLEPKAGGCFCERWEG